MKKLLILHILILLFFFKSYSQGNFSASFGMGLPELANAGVQYQFSQMTFGVSIGTAFAGFYSLSGDVYYHFKDQSKLDNISPWYLRTNFSYWPFGKILFVDFGEAILVGFRAGREFDITDSVGLRMDAGVIPFTFLSGKKVPFSFIPAVGINFYYRL